VGIKRVLREDVAVGIDEVLEGDGVDGAAERDGGDEVAPEIVDELLVSSRSASLILLRMKVRRPTCTCRRGDLHVEAVLVHALFIIGLDDGEAGDFHLAVGFI